MKYLLNEILHLENFYHFIGFVILIFSIIYISKIFFKYNWKKKELILLIFSILSLYFTSIILLNRFLIFVIILPLYYFFYKKSEFVLIKIIILTLEIIIINKISELVTVAIGVFLDMQNIIVLNFFENIIYIFLVIFLSRKIYILVIKNIIVTGTILANFSKIISLCALAMILIYNIIAIYSAIEDEHIFIYYLSVSILFSFIGIFIVISISLFKNYQLKLQNEVELEKLNQQKKYIASLEKNNNEIRKFKHDFNNILLGLSGYILTDNIDKEKLKQYFSENVLIINKELEINSEVLTHLSYIKVPSLKSLITNKVLLAQNNKINVKINIENDITETFTNEMQLSRVLGILLDNAIEACLELDSEKKLVINILRIDKTIEFQITNTFNNKNIPIKKLNEVGYSTKGEDRGLGLSTAHEIVDKYNMILDTIIEENIFKQNLLIEGEFYESYNM